MVGEAELVRQVLEGSHEAFRDLVRMHQAAVQAYLGRYVRNLDIVEDLAQESFLKAYRNLGAYRGDSSFRVWLFGIARNEALMHLREERARRGQGNSAWLSSLERWTMELAESEERSPELQERKLSALDQCIGRLPQHSAALVEAYYVKGHAGSRIARDTGKSEVAIRVTLLRIRESLRECVKRRLAGMGVNA